jgi:hypothetical protein
MKIKTIEKIINLNELFEIIKEVIQPKFKVDERSTDDENGLILIASDKNSRTVQICAFKDLEFSRTIISILILKENQKNSNFQFKLYNKQDFYNIITSESSLDYSQRKKIEYSELEDKLLKKLLKKVKNRFGYKDRLLNYPFSLTPDFDFNGEYFAIYSKFLDLIERRLVKFGVDSTHIFRYYDFAKNSEIYQRIIDMIVISDKIVKERENNTHWMLFIFSNKSQDKLKLLELVKLFGEIKNYSKVIQDKLSKKNQSIKPALVILSTKGFEETLPNYLRNHLYGEFEHIIPIFLIPPSNDDIWHNLNKDRSLTADLKRKQKEVQMKIKRLRMITNPAPYRKDQIDSETKILTDTKDKIHTIEKNYKLIDEFSEILSIEKFKQIFNIKGEKSTLNQEKLTKSNELLFI